MALFRLYYGSMKALLRFTEEVARIYVLRRELYEGTIKALSRLYSGAIKALSRLYQASVKALSRLYQGPMKALLRLY
jgi:hypothetical protein